LRSAPDALARKHHRRIAGNASEPSPGKTASADEALGLGSIIGGYTGARMQSRLPDTLIRRTVGILATAIAARYLWSGLN
jgi:uncharacterized protein